MLFSRAVRCAVVASNAASWFGGRIFPGSGAGAPCGPDEDLWARAGTPRVPNVTPARTKGASLKNHLWTVVLEARFSLDDGQHPGPMIEKLCRKLLIFVPDKRFDIAS